MDREAAVRRRQHLSQRLSAMQNGTVSSRPAKPTNVVRLARYVRQYPLMLVLIVWLTFVAMAGASVIVMMNLDASKQSISLSAPAPTALPQTTPLSPNLSAPASAAPPESQSSQSLPLISLVAIVLSCAMGCTVFLQWLKPRPLPKQKTASVFSNPVPRKAQRADSADEVASASIVPAETSHPLDWEDPSLADSLDMRQQRPLSHWL